MPIFLALLKGKVLIPELLKGIKRENHICKSCPPPLKADFLIIHFNCPLPLQWV